MKPPFYPVRHGVVERRLSLHYARWRPVPVVCERCYLTERTWHLASGRTSVGTTFLICHRRQKDIGKLEQEYPAPPLVAADLFDVALSCDPPPPMNGNNEQARRTSFGSSLGKMRKRIFRVGDLRLRVVKAGISHQAVRWKLMLMERTDTPNTILQPKVGEPQGS